MIEHIVVAGGGVGALEGLLALQSLAGDRLRISLLTAASQVTYRALAPGEQFGGAPAPQVEWSDVARDRGVDLIPHQLRAVRADERAVDLDEGDAVGYDALLLALGARAEPALAGALSFAAPGDGARVKEALDAFAPGRTHSVALIAMTGTTWTLPLYELALLIADYARGAGLQLAIDLITPESAPLGVFGADASASVSARLDRAGVRVRCATFAEEVADGNVWLELEGPLPTDLAIALPRLRGPAVPGLPHDADGFVPVDRFGRVSNSPSVWAVGDMTTRPLKQGGLAAQQADVAAADIAARAGADVPVEPYRPVLHGLLLTGGTPEFLERRPHDTPGSAASPSALWWPPHKIVGRHVAPYLARLGALDSSAGAAPAEAGRREDADAR